MTPLDFRSSTRDQKRGPILLIRYSLILSIKLARCEPNTLKSTDEITYAKIRTERKINGSDKSRRNRAHVIYTRARRTKASLKGSGDYTVNPKILRASKLKQREQRAVLICASYTICVNLFRPLEFSRCRATIFGCEIFRRTAAREFETRNEA